MLRVGFPLFLAFFLVLSFVPLVESQETGQTSITLVSAQEGADYIWRIEGRTERNPTLVVAPSSEITITAKKGDDTADIPHNLQVGSGPVSDSFAAAGESITYTFSSLASGTQPYICTIHPATMLGTVRVAGTPEEEDEEAPAAPLALALLAIAAAALFVTRRR